MPIFAYEGPSAIGKTTAALRVAGIPEKPHHEAPAVVTRDGIYIHSTLEDAKQSWPFTQAILAGAHLLKCPVAIDRWYVSTPVYDSGDGLWSVLQDAQARAGDTYLSLNFPIQRCILMPENSTEGYKAWRLLRILQMKQKSTTGTALLSAFEELSRWEEVVSMGPPGWHVRRIPAHILWDRVYSLGILLSKSSDYNTLKLPNPAQRYCEVYMYEPYSIPTYQASTTSDLDLRLGRIINRDAQIEVEKLTIAPVRILVSRSLWEDNKLACEAPDGKTGTVHGACSGCHYSMQGCNAFHRVLCVCQDDFPEESESGMFWFQFSIRSRNPFNQPRNAGLMRALQGAMITESAVVVTAKTASNKTGSMHWSIFEESKDSLVIVPRETAPPENVTILGVWNNVPEEPPKKGGKK